MNASPFPAAGLDWAAILLTLKLATLVSAILLAIALPLAYWLTFSRKRWSFLVDAVVALPLVLPPTVLGFYILVAIGSRSPIGRAWTDWTGEPLAFTFEALVIASVLYSLPFAVQPMAAAFEQLDPALIDASATLGASSWRTFRQVVLPLSRHGVLASVVLSFAHTIGEFGVVLMVGGNLPGATRTVSISIYDDVQAFRFETAHQTALLLLLFSFAVLTVVYALLPEAVGGGAGAMTLTLAVRKRLSPAFELDVSLNAEPGVTMLFGRSGSGKTTVLRLVAGLLRPDRGRIAVGDRLLFDSGRSVNEPVRQRRIGYVFQQLALFPHLTVAGNIEYGLAHLDARARRERARDIADSFHIGHLLARRPDAVSGGERQRTALARALVTDPDVLLLDEPLSALDYVTQARIMDDLRVWNEVRRIPVLYVTHAHREVFSLGDRVVVLDGGRISAEGTPYEVMEMPGTEPLAQMVGFENFFSGIVTARRPDAATMTCRLEGTSIDLEVPAAPPEAGPAVRIGLRAGDILLATEEPRGLSARNVLRGHIASLRREGPTIVADVTVAHASTFRVHLTPGARESLQLTPGLPVWLIVKTHSCRIMREVSPS